MLLVAIETSISSNRHNFYQELNNKVSSKAVVRKLRHNLAFDAGDASGMWIPGPERRHTKDFE